MPPRNAEIFVSVEILHRERRVELVRSEEPFASLDEIASTFDRIGKRLKNIDTSRWGLLTDLRQARGRNDPEFEQELARHRDPLNASFRRVAVVVETAVGRIQVMRQTRTGPSESRTRVFNDLNAARRWLAEGSHKP